ncbi:MAG: Phosphoglucosamine mutase [Acidimicrobiales bacterium]|nr:MAG: phosphoglucosamine mutase [Actinomycetota bacterium]MBV6507940.1 Phosphoglucosamine mutase [Acidimicrobiales bacterium]RIK06916.1 MAG: phosphoglucosamine mutase [Acidobacteriota bacterium]
MRFGTDGVRGEANTDVTPELATAIGRAAIRVLGGDELLVGRDTRRSGPMLAAALAAGAASEGARALDLGVLPTPAVARLAAVDGCAAAVISASHNPFGDNGIKLFSAGGLKLDDELQSRLEAGIDEILGHSGSARPVAARVGTVEPVPEALERYGGSIERALEGHSLDGLRVVADCANGAASVIAPHVLRRLGAEVEAIHAEPDGININHECGSTHPESLQQRVLTSQADAGVAFDGDADRVVAVGEDGALVDGDHIVAMLASDLRSRGRLRESTVVVTVMSNLGFRQAMSREGIRVVETPVGDRHVLEALERGHWSLGGEQSGHVIFRDLATTGDGLLTAVLLLDLVRRSGAPLSRMSQDAMQSLPQVLVNVRVVGCPPDIAAVVADVVAAEEEHLGGSGRVLVRPSGTEPVVRVMVEAPTEDLAQRVAGRVARAVEAACG